MLPFLPLRDLPNAEIEPGTPALQADSLLSEPPGKPQREDHSSEASHNQRFPGLEEYRPRRRPDSYSITLKIKLLTTPCPGLGHTVLTLTFCVSLCMAKQLGCSFLLHPKLCFRDLIPYWYIKAEFWLHHLLFLF